MRKTLTWAVGAGVVAAVVALAVINAGRSTGDENFLVIHSAKNAAEAGRRAASWCAKFGKQAVRDGERADAFDYSCVKPPAASARGTPAQ